MTSTKAETGNRSAWDTIVGGLGNVGITPLGAVSLVILALLPLVPPFNQEHIMRWLIAGAYLAAQAVALGHVLDVEREASEEIVPVGIGPGDVHDRLGPESAQDAVEGVLKDTEIRPPVGLVRKADVEVARGFLEGVIPLLVD